MRQIVLDTETTGLSPDKGDRIIEIAAIEIINRRISKHFFHRYVNPERDVPLDSVRVHGITTERLENEPIFLHIADEFLQFIGNAELIIHNAKFDVGFINMELEKIGKKPLANPITDTIEIAKNNYPGKSYSLNNLCDFFHIDRSKRTQHGALIDTELLGEVYLALTRGQESFSFDSVENAPTDLKTKEMAHFASCKIILASQEELRLHENYLNKMENKTQTMPIWKTFSA